MNRARRTNPNLASGNNDHNVAQHPGTPRPGPASKQAAAAVATPNSTPVKPILKPILKKEVVAKPAAPAAVVEKPETPKLVKVPEVKVPIVEPKSEIEVEMMDASDASESVDNSEAFEKSDENGTTPRKPFFKKIFGGVRKKPSVRAKERKIRQNRHLRKVILPKNALMALYEIKGIQIGDFIINSNIEGGFTAMVTVNGCQYEAVGNSKNNAKTNACEKALRDFVIKRMMIQKTRDNTKSERMETESIDASKMNDASNGDDGNGSAEEADDVPMVNLASFALYKLFSAWENEGFHVPEFHPNPPQHQQQNSNESTATKKSVGRNELPPNWEIMHPATLLCIMRPRLTYTDCGKTGDSTNPVQTVKVIVDDREFVGVGRSKKVARKNVAIAVCNSLFGTNFQCQPQEE